MVIRPIKIILLFVLFSLISSEFEHNFLHINQGEKKEYYKSYSFKLIKANYDDYTNKFIQFIISSNSAKNQIVYFSDRDNSDCQNGRLLIGMQPYDPINLIIPKDIYEDRFLCVECLADDTSCNYSLEYKLFEKPKIYPKEKYNFLLSNQGDNTIEFSLNSDSVYNLWVKGINMTIDVLNNVPKYKSSQVKNGKIYQIIGQQDTTFSFKVRGEFSDFITIGSNEIRNSVANDLQINDLEIMGILTEENKEICFPIKRSKYITNENELIYINGYIYTKRARTYFKYGSIEMPNTDKNILDGSILELSTLKDILDKNYCISFLKDVKNVNEGVFSLQLSSYKNSFYSQLIYPPLIPGVIYPHYLLKDEVAVFQGLRPRGGAQEINFNMKSIKGFPDMYFHNCTTFPHCSYNESKLYEITDPHQSNRMSVYSFYLKDHKISSIGAFQPLMIVKCKEGQTEKEKNTGYCTFETAIFTDKDRLRLKEADTFTQFLLKGEKDLYTIDFQFEENIEKIYIDVIVFSGDVSVIMEDEVSKVVAFKYFLSNKIFYSITRSYMGDSKKIIDFRVQAQKNSFYLIQYQLVRAGDQSINTNIIESGINFVESIAVGENQANYKYVEIENHKIEGGAPFLASFYSKNCRFVISTETPNKSEYLDMIGNFGQMIIDSNNPIYYEDKYKFKIQAIDTDPSVYDSKLCMVYVSGLELNDKSSPTQRTISLSEGVPHSYIFNQNYTRMAYSYHLGDRQLPVVIDLNLIDKDIFKVEILFNYINYKEIDVYRNLQVFIPSKDLLNYCPEDEICTVNVFITLTEFSKPRRIETTISQVNGAPTYLEKNTFKQDYIVGNYNKYYYFDIGAEERGDVTVYYKRNSGHIFGKIVSKLDVEEINGSDWRGLYTFPKNLNESSLVYDPYYQKLIIQDMNSQNCTYGCYVLLTVRASNERQDINITDGQENLVPYRITIIPRISVPNITDYNQFPKVKIPVNEYVIGDINIKVDEEGNKKESYNYYEIWLPYDSDLIYIDWQADKPQLLINVGSENPTVNNADFKFPSTDQDTVLRISKEEIIEALKKRGMVISDNQTIRYFNLTIGIYTEKIDTLYSSVYAFKVFQPPIYQTKDKKEKAAFEIIHIRSDQKVLCDPAQIGACLFAVIFDEGDINNNLILYPRVQNPNAHLTYYGDFVDAAQVERNNLTYIIENIRTNNEAKFNPSSGKKYIFTEKVERGKCLLLYVEVDISTIVEIFSSTSNNYQITPNPNTPQIFAIQDKQLNLNFEEQHDLLINIVSVSGEGYFYWENEKLRKFYLSGEGDRLSLTAKGHGNSTKLIAQSTQFIWANSTDQSGFVFYITHYPRNSEYSIDQVKAGRSTEFNYREAKFPLNFFTKLTEKDITVSFNFYDYYKGNEFAEFQYKGKLLKIWGTVITEEQAYKARNNKEFKPKESDSKPIYGTVDGPLGLLYLNQTDIEKYNIDPSQNRTLFFSVEMLNATDTNITGVSLELSILGEQGIEEINSVIPENVYINGKLTNNEYFGLHYLRYKLRVDKKNPYMNIEFSASSIFVNWAVSNNEYVPENCSLFEEVQQEKKNGRVIYKFKVPESPEITNYLYLIIFNIDKQTIEPELSNFVFKYMNFKDSSSFYNFEQPAKVGVNQNDKDYIVTFKPGKSYKNGEELTYYVKGVYYDTVNVDEIKDSIAISESQGISKQLNNPIIKENDDIEIKLENVDGELSHIKVMVKLKLNAMVEYLLYDIVDIHAETKPESSKKFGPIDNYIDIIYNGTAKYTMIDFEVDGKIRYLQKYRLKFLDSFFIPRYLKVETKSTTDKIENQIIYFTKNNKREQLAQKGYGFDNVMWLKREQFNYNNEVEIEVQCQNKIGKCAYTLQFSGHDVILIQTSTLVYNYYITNENQIMDFKIANEIEDVDTQDTFLTFYATGYKPIQIDVKNCLQCEQYKFRAGTAITVDLIKRKFFELTITAKEGDFISIGSKYTLKEGKSPGNTLNPNARQITGYLKRHVLEKECYLLPDESNDKNIFTYYLSLLFYNRVAKVTFADAQFNQISNTENIDNGHYTYVYNHKLTGIRYLCVEFPSADEYDINDIPYTIQLTEPKSQQGLLNIYTPQLNGNIYPRIINKGSVVFFNAVPPNSDSKEQIYNMMTLEGIPQMYIYKCTNYPLCDIDIGNLDKTENIIRLNEINGMASWVNTEPKKYNPIQAEQYIMYVKCPNLENQNYDVCKFQTTILGNNDTVVLVERQPFSQYILKNEPDSFLINFEFEKNIVKIYVDTLVISGDVSFTLKDAQSNKEIDSHKYYLGNKIFYSIDRKKNGNTKSIRVEIFAKKNSYYVVEYKLLKNNYEQTLNDVYAGINYLIPVPKNENENQKLLTINNVKLLAGNKYLTSFKSLNCRFQIEGMNKDSGFSEIRAYGTYAQELIKDENELKKTKHTYKISALDKDTSSYQKGMCMLYVSGLEITKSESPVQRELLVSQGVPQTTVFEEGLEKVRFVYPHTDKNKNILVIFDVINAAKYQVKITYNHNETELSPFSSNYVYYVSNQILEGNCKPNEICTVIAELTVIEKYNGKTPIIETTIRETGEVPLYLPKGVSKRNYAAGNKILYFFTDVGLEDSGYISINFERGSFEVYAKVVEKNLAVSEENADWRQYKFPDKNEKDGLLFDFYNKRLSFSNVETHKCQNGCYILISLKSTVQGSLQDDFRYFPFTISVTMNSKGDSKKTGEIIEIHQDEYVIGCLDKYKKEKYEYYQINIPYDAEAIEFDFQSDVGILLVNGGNGRPVYGKKETHFTFENTKGDTVYRITRDELKSKAGFDSIDNKNLIIAVYSEEFDSYIGAVYSFKVHFYEKLNIHKVNSDHKTLCKPEKVDNGYRCLYMINFIELDFINDVTIYSNSQSKTARTYMFGKFIDKEIYDKFDIDKLRENIPNENAEFNTKKSKLDFIFITLPDVKSHFYVSVISDEDEVIEFVSSFLTFDKEFTPNPSTRQILPVKNEAQLKLNFKTQKSLLINLVSIYGEAKLYWEKEPNVKYHLRGRDDRLSFALTNSYENGTLPSLIIDNKDYMGNQETVLLRNLDGNSNVKNETPTFAFYLEYYLRSPELNLDEAYIGKTTEFVYDNTEFPFNYYSKLNNLNNTVNIFFNFHDVLPANASDSLNRTRLSWFEFNLRASIIKQSAIYKITENKKPEIKSGSILGRYDPALQTGQINFPANKLKSFGVKDKEKPTLYIELLKQGFRSYKNIRLELSVVPENSDIVTTEKLYQYGKIENISQINSYKLKVDNATGFMRIQFSANNPNIKYVISEEKNSKNSAKYAFEKSTQGGKELITFIKPNKDFIYLNVYLEKEAITELSNYVFKYINSKEKNNFFEYIPKNGRKLEISKPEIKGNRFKITAKFMGLHCKNNNTRPIKVTYALKAVFGSLTKGHDPNENKDSIAICESRENVIITKDPKGDEITLELESNIPRDSGIRYSQLIAQVIDGPINEYYSYGYRDDYGFSNKAKSDSNPLLIVVIVVALILFVIIVILIIVVLTFSARNKNLMDKVNAVSFVDPDEKGSPLTGTNLLMEGKNEIN